MAVLGEPLYAIAQNLDQSDNGYVSVGGASAKVVSQGFRTGPRGTLLRGIGVSIEGSNDLNGNPQVPDSALSVSVSVHADSNGKPGAKLFDLVSPANTRRATASSRRRPERRSIRTPPTCWCGATSAAPCTGCIAP